MSKVLVRTTAAPATLTLVSTPSPSGLSQEGEAVAVTWSAVNVAGGVFVSGGRAPYVYQNLSHASGALFPVGTTAVTGEVLSGDGQTVSFGFNVVVTEVAAPPPADLSVTCPTTTTTISLDGNPVAVTWPEAGIDGGAQPYTVVYTHVNGGDAVVVSGDSFALGTHTIRRTVTDSSDPQQIDTCTFTRIVSEGSGGDIAELSATHPRLGVEGAAGVSALRTRLLNASYFERAYLQQLLNDLPTKLGASALTVAYTGSGTNSGQKRARNGSVGWGAMNCAFIAMLDPAALRTAGLTTPGWTMDNGRVLSSTYTASELADAAYELLTTYGVSHQGANGSSWLDVLQMPLGLVSAGQHAFRDSPLQAAYFPPALTYDWCASLWTSAQRLVFAQRFLELYSLPTLTANGSGTHKAADSSFTPTQWAENAVYQNGWFIGNQVAWDSVMRPIIYLAVLNDPEFGDTATQTAVWDRVAAWVNRLAEEVAFNGGTGFGHQESMVAYCGDSYSVMCTFAGLAQTAWLASNPFEACIPNFAAMPHTYMCLRRENERGVYDYLSVNNDVAAEERLQAPGNHSHMLIMLGVLESWGDTEDARAILQIIEDMGAYPPPERTSGRWDQAVLRQGLLWPFGHLTAASPSAWDRVHDRIGIVTFGDLVERDRPQYIQVSMPYTMKSGGHHKPMVTAFSLACGGNLIVERGPNAKGVVYKSNLGQDLQYRTGVFIHPNGASANIIGIDSNESNLFPAPYETFERRISELLHVRADGSDYRYILCDWQHAHDKDLPTGLTGAHMTTVEMVLSTHRLLVQHHRIEGIPTGYHARNQMWVNWAPVWIGGSVSDVMSGGENTVVYWRSSSDADGWSITNDSSGGTTASSNRLMGHSATHAKAFITPLLPTTGRTLHAKGGNDPAGSFTTDGNWFGRVSLHDSGAYQGFQSNVNSWPQNQAEMEACWRSCYWGRVEVVGANTATNECFLTAFQYGHSGSGDTYYVGSRVAVSRRGVVSGAASGGDVLVYPHSSEPCAIFFPRGTGAVGGQIDWVFDIPVAASTKLLLTGLPVSQALSVTGANLGGGEIRITVATGSTHTTASTGTLLVTVATNGSVT